MPLAELDKFRSKFPDYNDLDDATLANLLARKYPEYQDLRDKVGQQPRQTLSVPQPNTNIAAQTARGTIGVLGQSAGKMLGGIYDTVRHPIQTAKNLATAATHPIQTGKAVVGYAKERYGSPEKIAETVATDPFGFVGDVASVAYGGKAAMNPVKTVKSIGSSTKTLAKNTGKAVTAPIRYAKDLIETPGKAKKLAQEEIFKVGQETAVKGRELSKQGSLKAQVAETNFNAVKKGYDDLGETLKKAIKKEGNKETLKLQKELPQLFKKKSAEYGQRLDKLVQGKGLTISGGEAVKSLEDVLIGKGVLRHEEGKLIVSRSPKTGAESEIYNLYQGTKQQLIDNPGANIAIEDLMRSNDYIKPNYGKAWTPDDYMRANLHEKFSYALKDTVPGLKELKAEYRPYFEWKKKAIERFKPFAGKYETRSGTSLLSKVGTEKLTGAEARLVADLEKQLGREVGGKIKAYQKGVQGVKEKQLATKEKAKAALREIKELTADAKFKLRQDKTITTKNISQAADKIAAEYTKKRAVAGAVGAVAVLPLLKGTFLKYFIRRELFNALKGHEL